MINGSDYHYFVGAWHDGIIRGVLRKYEVTKNREMWACDILTCKEDLDN